jgi:hypothetical protein
MASVYDSERLAGAYAFDRPSIHEQILRSARVDRQADRALDIGCGAGLSTAALALGAQGRTGGLVRFVRATISLAVWLAAFRRARTALAACGLRLTRCGCGPVYPRAIWQKRALRLPTGIIVDR